MLRANSCWLARRKSMFHPRSNVSTNSPRLTQQPHGPGHLAISILFLCRPQDACSILWLRWLSTKWTVPVAGVERRQSMLLLFKGLTTTSAHIALASVHAVGHSQLQGRLGKVAFSWVATCPDKTPVYRRRGHGCWGDGQQALLQHSQAWTQSTDTPS